MNPRALLVVALGCALPACGDSTPQRDEGRLSLVDVLAGADTAGFARAVDVRPFEFPIDHGPHPDFRSEWWYVTGNLDSDRGPFGFQFTIFRTSLAPFEPGGPSRWATRQAFMGHFAVTDVAGERFWAEELFSRGAVDLAGADTQPLRIWIEDWTLAQGDSATTFPLRLFADGQDVALDLQLAQGKPAILQGEDGLSRKGPEPGNASYYYSHTRMPASGVLTLEGQTIRVHGSAWLDREWSTSALPEGVVGWDWFALQLDNGWDVMAYGLRREDGSVHPLSDGVLVAPDGAKTHLAWGPDLSIEVTEWWASAIDGAQYPAGWTLEIPRVGWSLEVEPVVSDQELDLTFRYWEGAVRVRGTDADGRELGGRGYAELTGYAGLTRGR